MFCTNCGERLADGAGACAACGHAADEPVAAEPDGTSEPGNSPMRRRTVWMVLGGLIALVLVAAALIVSLRGGGNNNEGRSGGTTDPTTVSTTAPSTSTTAPRTDSSGPSGWLSSEGMVMWSFEPGPAAKPEPGWTQSVGRSAAFMTSGDALIVTDSKQVRRLDVRTGETLWSYTVPKDLGRGWYPQPAGDRVIVTGARIAALDVRNGVELWSMGTDGGERSVVDVVDDVLVTESIAPRRVLLEFWSTANGAALWSADVTAADGFMAPYFRADDALVTVLDGRLQARALATGSDLGTHTVDKDAELVASGPGYAALKGKRGTWVVRLDDGREVLSWRDELFIDELVITDGLLLWTSNDGGGIDVYDLEAGGAELWARPGASDGSSAPPVLRVDGRLLVGADEPTGKVLVLLDARTGEPVSTLRPATGFANINGLTDHALLMDSTSSVTAYSWATGDRIWQVDTAGAVTVVGDALIAYDQQSGTATYLR